MVYSFTTNCNLDDLLNMALTKLGRTHVTVKKTTYMTRLYVLCAYAYRNEPRDLKHRTNR